MKKSLKPYDVIYTFYDQLRHRVVLAYSIRHASKVLFRYYMKNVVRSPDCLEIYDVQLITHIR